MNIKEAYKASGRIMAMSALAVSLNACEASSQFLPSQGEREVQITNASERYVDAPISLTVDRPYLQTLYANLQKESGTKEGRLNAIRNNLSIILGTEGNNGTTLRIDENGTFLTVAHTLTRNVDGRTPVTTFTESVHLNTGVVSPIKNMYLNLDNDIAVFYAPTGNSSKPTEGIQFNPKPLEAGTQVWLMGINQPKGSERFDLHMAAGSIVVIPSDAPDYFRRFIFAKGIKGIGGTSGGPIVDKDGKIVGLMKGTTNDPNTNQEYTLIVPISQFQTLINQSNSYSLPTQPTR